VRLSPLGTAATIGLLYQPKAIADGDCAASGGMKIGRGNRSTRRRPAPVPLCPPQIPHELTRAAAVRSQRFYSRYICLRYYTCGPRDGHILSLRHPLQRRSMTPATGSRKDGAVSSGSKYRKGPKVVSPTKAFRESCPEPILKLQFSAPRNQEENVMYAQLVGWVMRHRAGFPRVFRFPFPYDPSSTLNAMQA
jgi:hypothetical protein